jgi:hypothetical protein
MIYREYSAHSYAFLMQQARDKETVKSPAKEGF